MKKIKHKINKPYFYYCSTSLGTSKEDFVK